MWWHRLWPRKKNNLGVNKFYFKRKVQLRCFSVFSLSKWVDSSLRSFFNSSWFRETTFWVF
jgi:hypothetical protein